MPVFIDQLGREVNIPKSPKRIVSLVPSLTELLADLGLEEEVVGLTKFCVHPHGWKNEKTVVGGTKDFKIDRIRYLNPDLVIANKEENTRERIEEIATFCPVWVSDVPTVESAVDMILALGQVIEASEKAQSLAKQLTQGFVKLTSNKQHSVLYLIWQKPFMAAGKDTFIHDMLKRVGLTNVVDSARYPELTIEQIKELNPELILLSSEPFPFKEKHRLELERQLKTQVELVDGEMLSWYGSRMLKAIDYMKKRWGSSSSFPRLNVT